MELMDKILSQKNLQEAMKRVKSNMERKDYWGYPL